jgi:hypothetical protein
VPDGLSSTNIGQVSLENRKSYAGMIRLGMLPIFSKENKRHWLRGEGILLLSFPEEVNFVFLNLCGKDMFLNVIFMCVCVCV